MRWRIFGALLVVLSTGWLLAGVAASTFSRDIPQTYPAALGGAAWIEAAGGPQHAYFRLSLDLPAAPDLATLWITADQQYRVYADDNDIASTLPPTKAGLPPLADPVDLSSRLRKGQNAIGVEVINNDHGPAAFRAKLSLDFGGKQVNYVTSAAGWQAASGVQQVRFAGSNTKDASFSAVSFDAGQWPAATPTPQSPAQPASLMPPAVEAGPLTGKVISAGASSDMLASDVLQVPPGVSGAWLRVVASDPYSLSVNGHVVASQAAAYFPVGPGSQRLSHALGIYAIGGYLRAGRDLLLVHVYGDHAAALYLDSTMESPTGPVHLASGPGWHAADTALATAGQPPAPPAFVLGPLNRVWPGGLTRAVGAPGQGASAIAGVAGQQSQTLAAVLPEVPGAASAGYALVGMAFVVVLWLWSGLAAARLARRPLGPALLVDAAGHLPALAAAGAVATVARLANWVPPWPYVPAVFWLVVTILAAGKFSAFQGSAAISPGWPGWPARLLRHRRRVPMPLSAPVAIGRHAVPRHPSPLTAAWARLALMPRLAMAGEAVQAGAAFLLRVDTKPAWRPSERLRTGHTGLRPGPGHRLFSRLTSRSTWVNGCVVMIALAGTGQLAYGLGYEPYSGDETVSLLAAQSIRAHLLPQFPSGLLYLKGELYEYPLALYTAIFGQGPVADRLPTIFTYGATVLAFGLLLLPVVLRGRHRLAQVVLTLLFATAPMELLEPQLVRMYQQEQLFAVLFVSFFLLALRAGRTAAGLEELPAAPEGRLWALLTRWSIPLSAITVVAMYLSLEESFIVLPAIPVVLLAGLGLRWSRDRQWLKWGLPAAAIIGLQYCLTIVTKMPVLGYDRSNKPYIDYDPSQFYYYLAHYLLAVPGGSGRVPAGSGNGTLYLITSLAVVAGVAGAARRDFTRVYLSAFTWVPILVLSTVFSAYAERYILIMLPGLFVLAGLGALDILGWLRALFVAGEGRQPRLAAGLILAATVPGFIWLAGSLPARIQDYGLAASRLAGVPYAQQQPDYSMVAAYMKAHERPGDLFITLASTTAATFYAGRAPDMIIQPHPNKLLYLTEKNGIVIDVYYGKPVILTAGDLEQVIASHRRVWLMTDQGPYFDSVPVNMTGLIRTQFTEVAGNSQTALYLRGSLCAGS